MKLYLQTKNKILQVEEDEVGEEAERFIKSRDLNALKLRSLKHALKDILDNSFNDDKLINFCVSDLVSACRTKGC